MKSINLTFSQLFFRISIIFLLGVSSFWLVPTVNSVKAASIIHVSPSGSDSPTCGSVSAPCLTIQYAIGKATSGDSILVAAGTYRYSAANDTCSFLVTPAVICYVDKNLTILGGYNPSDWSGPDGQRYPTIIDGGNTYRGVTVQAYNSTASLHMENFIIQNGVARGKQSTDSYFNTAFGGGMWAEQSSVVLVNMTFKNNKAIGANLPYTSGGAANGGSLAIISTKQGSSSLQNIIFDGNQALAGTGTVRGGVALGGALSTYAATLTGTNLTFTNNISQAGNSSGNGYDGGLRADALGGGASFSEGSNIDLNYVIATGNKAQGGNAGSNGVAGGGFGGGIHSEKGALLKLKNARITNNQVTGGISRTGGIAMGGGLMMDATDTIIDSAWVLANTVISGGSSTGYQAGAPGGGGGYFAFWSTTGSHTTSISNSVFADNHVQAGTPGIVPGGGGGGAIFQGVSAVVAQSTFAENTIGPGLLCGVAIVVQGNVDGLQPVYGSLSMNYSIISDHNGAQSTSVIVVEKNNSATFSHVLYANNSHLTNSDSVPVAPGSITLNNSLNASNVFYVSPGSPNFDYHLTASSPALDQAVGSAMKTDIDGQARPNQGTQPDLGADEYYQPLLEATPENIQEMSDDEAPIVLSVQIGTNLGQGVCWNASTESSWLYLGLSGTSRTDSQDCGTTLVIRLEPGSVGFGTFDANVQVSSPLAEPITIPIRLIKVHMLHFEYVPFTKK